MARNPTNGEAVQVAARKSCAVCEPSRHGGVVWTGITSPRSHHPDRVGNEAPVP
jgi:hypothetical protein